MFYTRGAQIFQKSKTHSKLYGPEGWCEVSSILGATGKKNQESERPGATDLCIPAYNLDRTRRIAARSVEIRCPHSTAQDHT